LCASISALLIAPAGDNKFAALNSAVWSGGSFVYVPENVHVDAFATLYINTKNMWVGFGRALIMAAPNT